MAYIFKNPHQQNLANAQMELRYAIEQRAILDNRIAELQRAIEFFAPLAHQEVEAPTDSLPQLCLSVLSTKPHEAWSATVIRDGLRNMGIEVVGKNPLGILYTAMGRLVASEYVRPIVFAPDVAVHYQITPKGFSVVHGR